MRTRHTSLTALVCSLPLLVAGNAVSAQCPAPNQPYCIYDSKIYEDQNLYNACKGKMDAFVAAQKSYTACLQTKFKTESDALLKRQQEEYDTAVNAGNGVISRFNCLQKKQPNCY